MIRPLLAALALIAAAPVAACAQDAPPPAAAPAAPGAPNAAPRHHHNRYMAALRTLNLSPDQHRQIAGLVHDARTASQGADHATRHANAKKLRGDIDNVLTPGQRAQLHAAVVQQRTPNQAQ